LTPCVCGNSAHRARCADKDFLDKIHCLVLASDEPAGKLIEPLDVIVKQRREPVGIGYLSIWPRPMACSHTY
jgi:hypothetical protein